MADASLDAAGVVVLYGATVIYIALFFPKALPFVPGIHWFSASGPAASRVAALLCATACIVMGLVLAQMIPPDFKGLAITSCAVLVVAGGLFDLSQAGRK
jgi:hypothetical protein